MIARSFTIFHTVQLHIMELRLLLVLHYDGGGWFIFMVLLYLYQVHLGPSVHTA